MRGIVEGTSVREIGEKIGPPIRWGGDYWERNVPLCWYYQDVEILFSFEEEPTVNQITINVYDFWRTKFRSSKLIRNVEGELYPLMTLDDFKRYAETGDHSLSEYRWSFQDAEERVFTLNDKAWVSFRQLYTDDDSDDFFPEYDPTVEYQLIRIGAPLDGLWEFYKDPRSAHYLAQREQLEQAGTSPENIP